MKKELSFWDILAWIVLAGIVLWLILKALGIISTPAIIEYAPIFGAVYLAGWAMHKLDDCAEDIHEIKNFNKATIKEINDIKNTKGTTH